MSENTENNPPSNRHVGGEKRNRHYAIFENTILANTSDSDEHDPAEDSSDVSPTLSITTTTPIETKRASLSSQHSTTASSTKSKLTTTTSPPSTEQERERQRSPSPSSSSSSIKSKRTSAEVGPSHLFWVPAHLHTDIAPANFDSFITKHSPPTSPVSSTFPPTSHPLIPTNSTDLALDLAYANETNEAALPRLRTLSRRRSSLRRATRLDFDDDDDDKHEDETEESMNLRIQTERQKSADRLSLYANENRSQNEGATHTKMLGLTSLRDEVDESSEDVVRDAEAMMENAEKDASGAAAALKRNLSVRLSAMSEYSPENDYDNQTLSRSGSLTRKSSASGILLRRGVRTRIRRESLPENLHESNDDAATISIEEPPRPSLSPNVESDESEHHASLEPTTSSSSTPGVTTGRVIVGPDGEITLITDDSLPTRRASETSASASPVALSTEVESAPLPLAVTQPTNDDAEKEPVSTSAVPSQEGSGPSIKSDASRPKVSGGTTNAEEITGGKEKDKDKDKETKPKKSSPWSWFRTEEKEAGKKLGSAAEHHEKAPESRRLSRKSDPNLNDSASLSTDTLPTIASTLPSSVSAPDLHKDADGSSPKGVRRLERSPSSSTREKMKKSMTSLLFSKPKGTKPASSSSVGEIAPIPESTTNASSSASSLPASTSSIIATTTSASPQAKPVRYTNNVVRYPIQVERGIYRLSHAKLANPRRPLLHQVLISNMMFWYLALISRQQKQQQFDYGEEEEEGEKEKKERRRWEKEEEKARKKREKEAKKAAAAEGKKKKKEKEKGLGLF